MSEVKKIFGIDLGTTYSAIASVREDGQAEIIPNSDNDRTTPSVVFLETPQNIVVGKIAKGQEPTAPDLFVKLVKRSMGEDNTVFYIHDNEYTPVKISSYILGRIAKDATEVGGEEVKDVVITCPAYFGEKERIATKNAGEMAGLNVVHILDEPVAAALSYGLNIEDTDKNILVYDLGGGTFDITVLRITANKIQVMCTEGDHRLGGADWDSRLVEYFIAQYQEQFPGKGSNIKNNPEIMAELEIVAEQAKKDLSKVHKKTVKFSHDGETAVFSITREKFNELTLDLLKSTIEMTDAVLETAKNLPEKIERYDEFLLVGGSTFMHQVQEAIESYYADRLSVKPKQKDPHEAVAKGAALFGHMEYVKGFVLEIANKIMGKDSSVQQTGASSGQNGADITSLPEEVKEKAMKEAGLLLGLLPKEISKAVEIEFVFVATKTYGVEALISREPFETAVVNLIFRNQKLPCSNAHTFGTFEENQTAAQVSVYSNDIQDMTRDKIDPGMCVLLGEASLELQAGLPAGSPIKITFTLTKDGTLTTRGEDMTGGKEVVATFQVGMNESEIEAAREEMTGITYQ